MIAKNYNFIFVRRICKYLVAANNLFDIGKVTPKNIKVDVTTLVLLIKSVIHAK